jgi:cytosine/adenosine deaminase-related metal-dependent hydrolase
MTGAGNLRIRGARVLRDGELVEEELWIVDGRIAASPPEGAETVDARGLIALAGLVDAHTHSYAQLCRDVVADDRLEPWLVGALAAGAGFDAETVGVAARLGALDALRHGATTVLDHATLRPGDPAVIMDAYEEVGVRLALAVQVSDRPLAATLPPDAAGLAGEVAAVDRRPVTSTADALARCREAIHAAAGRDGVTVLLGPSAPERCSGALLDGLAALAAEHGLAVHTHLLETPVQRATGDLVGRLAAHGLIGPRLSVAHACHLDARDIERLAGAGVSVAHNPLSNLALGAGRADLRALLDAGIAVGLGCDGWNTGGAQDVLAAARLALALRRPDTPVAEWPAPADVWHAAGPGGARVAGLDGLVGTLVPGAYADVLLVDPVRAGMVEGFDAVPQLVLGGIGAGLREAWVGGRHVLSDGEPCVVDAAAVAAHGASLVGRLRAAAAPVAAAGAPVVELLRALPAHVATP